MQCLVAAYDLYVCDVSAADFLAKAQECLMVIFALADIAPFSSFKKLDCCASAMSAITSSSGTQSRVHLELAVYSVDLSERELVCLIAESEVSCAA